MKRYALALAALGLASVALPAVTHVSLQGGTLTIRCDDANDVVQFQQWGGIAGQPLTYNTRVGVDPSVGSYNLLRTWSGQNGVPVNGNGIITGVTKVVIYGGGGDDNLSVHGTTPIGTVTELLGEAGKDILSGGGNTNDLLVGGAGDDTIFGNNGQDIIYGDGFAKLCNTDVAAGSAPSANGITLRGYRWFGGWQQVSVQKHGGGTFAIPGGLLGVGGYNGADQSWGNGSRTLDNIGEAGGGGYNEKLRADLGSGLVARSATVQASIHALQGSSLTLQLFKDESLVAWQTFAVNTGNDQTFTATSPVGFNRVELVLPDGPGTNNAVLSTASAEAILVGVKCIEFGVVEGDGTLIGFDAVAGVYVADLIDLGNPVIVQNEVKLSGSAGEVSYRINGQVLSGQGGVSSVGFGVAGGPVGVASSRGIDGGESMSIEPIDLTLVGTEATLTIGLNNGTQGQIVEYAVDAYNGASLLTTVTGQVSGPVNSLHTIGIAIGQPFTKLVLRNLATAGEPFALTKLSMTLIDPALMGGDDALNGGGGSDKIFGQAGNDTINWDRADNPQVEGGDVASGGFGADQFFQTNNAAYNKPLGFGRITDFVPGADKIHIKAGEVGLNALTASLVYGATHQGNKIVVDTTSVPGTTILRLPVGGTGKIFMDGTYPSLMISDFVLF